MLRPTVRPCRVAARRYYFGAFLNHYRKSPQPPECVVVDAAWIEPVSTAKFPANRENNREFCRIRPSTAIFMSDQRADSMPYSGIPYATEQGIFKRVSGNFFRRTGNLGILNFVSVPEFLHRTSLLFQPPRERVLDNYRRPRSCAPSTICQNPYLRPCLALSSAWKAA